MSVLHELWKKLRSPWLGLALWLLVEFVAFAILVSQGWTASAAAGKAASVGLGFAFLYVVFRVIDRLVGK